jgi:hypothetical protein
MIPPFYDENIKSDGEKKFFHVLADLSDEYVILHSLGIAHHQEKVFGEIDFVIICNEGILCLEVKGGLVSRENGLWLFTDRYGNVHKKTEGPFQQVLSGMFALRQHLIKAFGPANPISKCQYSCGVVFTDMLFNIKGPDIIPEVIFDSKRSSDEIERYICEAFSYWRNNLEEKHGFSGGKLSRTQIEKAKDYLRGDFGFIPSLGYIVDKTDEKLLSLTKEQARRLAIAGDNPRILLRGGAGTGKTLLGMEYARRHTLTGKTVLYLCFNNNLSRYLDQISADSDLGLYINTFHGFIINELKKAGFMLHENDVLEDKFYTNILPDAFLNMVSKTNWDAQYDVVVIDEGQDLFRTEYLLCLDVMIKGGLESGRWHMCYDPNQNIYNPFIEEGVEYLVNYHPTILTLDTNCRNTKPVGVYNTLLSGIEPARFFRVDGEGVQRESYKDFKDEKRQLVKMVRRLLGQGIQPGAICLLSQYKYENSCLQGENIFKGVCDFQNVTNLSPGYWSQKAVKFSTIHSFKGLEAPIIFLLDVESFRNDNSRLLNYTAMSRAKALLYIYYNANVRDEMLEMVDKSMVLLEKIES